MALSARPARCLATWAVVTAVAGLLAAWAAPDLADAPRALGPDAPFDQWLTALCAAAVAGCAAWAWAVTTVVVAEALAGTPRTGGRGVPAWARRAVLAACGLAVLGAAPATATDGPGPPPPRGDAAVLDGLPLPDRAEGGSVSETVADALAGRAVETAEPVGADPPEPGHVVRPGESLWSIAAERLRRAGRPTDDRAVAAYWPEIHALNREVVGSDPDVLRPGQPLRLPEPPRPTPTWEENR